MNDLRQTRLQKMEQIDTLFQTPTIEHSQRSTDNSRFSDSVFTQRMIDEEIQVEAKGRVHSKRGAGKIVFLDVLDQSGKLQVFLEIATLGEERFANLKQTLDIGDIVEARGKLFNTSAGELTLKAEHFAILAKCINPPPIGKTHDGEHSFALNDEELKNRKRQLHLIARPEDKEIFFARARMIREIRSILEGNDFIELQTPVLQPLQGGATAKPFVTHHNALDQEMFLRVAPELYLKRAIASGFERVYELGPCFRNESKDASHSPEFQLLEFYLAFADYTATMDIVEHIVFSLMRQFGLECEAPFPRVSYSSLIDELISQAHENEGEGWIGFPETANELLALSEEERLPKVEFLAVHLGVEFTDDEDSVGILDSIFKRCIVRGGLFNDNPFFVTDHPIEISPLAKAKQTDPLFAERYQLIVNKHEIANGYSELTDPFEQRRRFEAQAERGRNGDQEAMPIDEDFVECLEYGLPPVSGAGIGIDRLLSVLLNLGSIHDGILFPAVKLVGGD